MSEKREAAQTESAQEPKTLPEESGEIAEQGDAAIASEEKTWERVHMLDLVRGIMILLMVGHHLLYDLVYIFKMPAWLVENPIIHIGSPIGAGIFILMSGATAWISRSNWRKSLKLLVAGSLVTMATYWYDVNSMVIFGILQFLGISSLLYAFVEEIWHKVPRPIMPAICGALLALSLLLRSLIHAGSWYLLPLGFKPRGLVTIDYFPLLPWFSIFMLGTWVGSLIFGRKLPAWFYEVRNPLLETCGRYSIWIYLVHQPLILLLLSFVFAVGGRT